MFADRNQLIYFVCTVCDLRGMGDDNDAFFLFMCMVLKNIHDFLLHRQIEVSSRLVGEKNIRLVGQHPCNGAPLLLAAGEP